MCTYRTVDISGSLRHWPTLCLLNKMKGRLNSDLIHTSHGSSGSLLQMELPVNGRLLTFLWHNFLSRPRIVCLCVGLFVLCDVVMAVTASEWITSLVQMNVYLYVYVGNSTWWRYLSVLCLNFFFVPALFRRFRHKWKTISVFLGWLWNPSMLKYKMSISQWQLLR